MALLGVAAETSIVMMLYLDEAYKNIKEKTNIALKEAIYHGAVLRLRPKLMTLFAILGGLIPIMYINSIGSEVMQSSYDWWNVEFNYFNFNYNSCYFLFSNIKKR